MLKKTLKGIALGFLALLLLLIIVPYAFRGKIAQRIRQELNEQVAADLHIGRVNLSLIRSFPDLRVQVRDILIVNHAPFKGDTLAHLPRVRVEFDIRSLWSNQGYSIKSIRLDKPDIRLRYLEDGSANWNIVPTDEAGDETAADEPFEFNLALQKADIRQANFSYHDEKWLTWVDVKNFSGTLRGDLTQDITAIHTQNTVAESLSIRYDQWPLLQNVRVGMTAEIAMNMKEWTFDFMENEFLINALPIAFDGRIGLPEGGGTFMDFSFGATRSDFAAFLSLVPAMYTADFENLETAGTLALNGQINGLLKEERIPDAEMYLRVVDGMFRYPGLEAAASQINMEANISVQGGDPDNLVLNLPDLTMHLAGQPVEARLALRTPISDPWIDTHVKGTLDLGALASLLPPDPNRSLTGRVESTLEARGNLSALEEGRYDAFHASGSLLANEVTLDVPEAGSPIRVSTLISHFSPSHLEVEDFQMEWEDTQLSAKGRLENLLPYALSGGTLSGRFEVDAGHINMHQLMESLPEQQPQETAPLSVIRIPERLDLTLEARAQSLTWGSLDIRQVEGLLRVVDQGVLLEPLTMNLLGGALRLEGAYHTRSELPEVLFGLDITQWDIGDAFGHLETIRLLAPVAQWAEGFFSGGIHLSGTLDQGLIPIAETLSGSGRISTSQLGLENHPVLSEIASRLSMDRFRNLNVRDLNLSFSFEDGGVAVRPFDFSFGNSTATLSGSTYYDKNIDYILGLNIPREQFGGSANNALEQLMQNAAQRGVDISAPERILLDINIGGTVTRPDISLDMSGVLQAGEAMIEDAAGQILQQAEDRARQAVDESAQEALDEARERLREEREARASQVEEAASRRAEDIRNEAARAAEVIRKEAEDQGKRLVEEASGAVARLAAQRAADALMREANQRANQLEEEADRRANQVVEEARREANRIRGAGD